MFAVYSFASGVLLSAAFKPIGLWFAAPLAIALLIYTVEKFGKHFCVFAAFAFSFNAAGLIWSNKYVGVAPWIALVLLQTLLFLPLGFLKKLGEYWYFYLPVAFLALEELRARFPFGGFGWLRIGFSQVDAPYARLASVGGVSLLSLATLLLGVAAFQLAKRGSGLTLPGIAIALTLTGIFIFPNNSPRQTFQVLAVQGSVPKLGLDFNERATAVFNRHLTATEKALASTDNSNRKQKRPDLILWPENSVDVDPFNNPLIGSAISKLVDKNKTPVIIGAVLRTDNELQNASILWEPKTGATTTYIKRHLTPFGEVMPLRSTLTFFSDLPNQVEDFSPGTSAVIHKVGQANIAPIICFELIDDQLIQSSANSSNLFVVQTNSATFANTAQSAQQLAITRIRSIEHARYAVSVSTVGISAIIDTNGVVLKSTKENIATSINSTVALNATKTIYDRVGEFAWVLVLLIGLGFGVALSYAARVGKRR
jgi:apolipoprotein N-acyltransferase